MSIVRHIIDLLFSIMMIAFALVFFWMFCVIEALQYIIGKIERSKT